MHGVYLREANTTPFYINYGKGKRLLRTPRDSCGFITRCSPAIPKANQYQPTEPFVKRNRYISTLYIQTYRADAEHHSTFALQVVSNL